MGGLCIHDRHGMSVALHVMLHMHMHMHIQMHMYTERVERLT